MSSQNSSVPERRPNILMLPARAEQGMSRQQRQFVFEQVKVLVLDIANRYFDLSLRIMRKWMSNDK